MAKSTSKKTGTAPLSAPAAASGNETVRADQSLQQLFYSELKEMYWAENHLVNVLPKMIAAASSSTLKQTLTQHLEVTVSQVSRLEQVFESLGQKLVAKKCAALEGLAISGEHVIENTVAGTAVRDTGIIMSALKVENFEATAYTGMIQVAYALGLSDAAALLEANLKEEENASNLLMELSQDTTQKSLA